MRIRKNIENIDENYEKMPVLFCIFTKIGTTEKVFNAIRKAKPKKLYISSDGWRAEKTGEKESVEYLRRFVTENINWDCEVFTKFNDRNLGCKAAMETAIDWFFDCEEAGIILEDDTLPAQSFFRFCSEILLKYKDNEEVFLINGTNETANKVSANSYSFKKICDTAEDIIGLWGWASWRRAWARHDKEIINKPKYKKFINTQTDSRQLDEYLKNARIKILANQMDLIREGKNNTWDLQWKFSVLINNGLEVFADCNLVTNIGAALLGAVHGISEYNVGVMLPTGNLTFPLIHPNKIAANPISPKEFRRASFFPLQDEMDFWEIEMKITENIKNISAFLAQTKAEISDKTKSEMFRPVVADGIGELLYISLIFGEYQKAQKYLYFALSKSLLQRDRNFCAKCTVRTCISACTNKSVFPYKNEIGDAAIGINNQTCRYCYNCMRACPVVNPK